jgi:hypothetical protein
VWQPIRPVGRTGGPDRHRSPVAPVSRWACWTSGCLDATRTRPPTSPRTSVPPGHWIGEQAATDVLALAAKGRASRSIDTLTVRQGGHHLLYGSALALPPAASPWARQTRAELAELTATVIR